VEAGISRGVRIKPTNLHLFKFRRWCADALGTRSKMRLRTKVLVAGALFLCSFVFKSLHAVDLSRWMYTPDQPYWAMSSHYDGRGASIVEGHGLLIPDDRRQIDTSIMAFSAGYSLYVGAVYYLFGRNLFDVQLIQNLLCSLSPVVLFLLAGKLISWRVGTAAGLLAGVHHGMSFYSNIVLPDSLAPLPILLAAYLLVRARRPAEWFKLGWSYLTFVAAGAVLGLSMWIRPNALLLGPFVMGILILWCKRPRLTLPRAAAMVAMAFLIVSPITIRNWIMFHRFVPVWIGIGTVLWQGIGEASGGRFGAPQSDEELGRQEAEALGNPHYAWWATPDGAERDRARISKSLAVIVRNPGFFAGSMLRRIWAMTQYSVWAPLIDVHFGERAEPSAPETTPSQAALAPGIALSLLRRPVKWVERLTKETAQTFLFLGGLATFFISRRRWFLIFMVPAYYLLFQSTIHNEFRYDLPMYYFLFIFSAVTWCLIIYGGQKILKAKWTQVATLRIELAEADEARQ
jgi:4-amino-4-deoxy-L-arabinose transferase-like glycosyltransferase